MGAMNLYGFVEPGIFSDLVRHCCEVFAVQASGALQLTLGRTVDHELLDELDQALASRTTIDQAIGILMGQQRCTAHDLDSRGLDEVEKPGFHDRHRAESFGRLPFEILIN